MVQFATRIPENEADAIAPIVLAWAADVAKKRAERGDFAPPPADRAAWFRAVVREFAARYSVAIDDGTVPVESNQAAPAKRRRKPAV